MEEGVDEHSKKKIGRQLRFRKKKKKIQPYSGKHGRKSQGVWRHARRYSRGCVANTLFSFLFFFFFFFFSSPVFGLPVFIILLHTAITSWSWNLFDLKNYTEILSRPSVLITYLSEFAPNAYTWKLAIGWNVMHIIIYMLAPGKIAKVCFFFFFFFFFFSFFCQGLPDPDTGIVLEYPMNGAFSLFVSYVVVFGGWSSGFYSPATLVANYQRLAGTVMILSFALSIYLYIRGQFAEHKHTTGSPIYDFYHGIERHPRIGFFDLKYFFEGRPGLTAWTCLSFVFMLAQYDKKGHIHPAMLICALLHALYNIDALYYEEGMLTMLDIVYDPFGWMLAFGDLAYVPFLYPLSALYLIDHSPDWNNWAFVGIAFLGALAYYAFRESNMERNSFKLGQLPNAKSLTMIRFDGTKTEYLVSGWSSLARRPNYWPDLLNAVAYSLCTGFNSTIAWIYPILFFVLLTHRQHRLEEKGRLTYRNWNDFVKAVPHRYIPYLI